MENEELDTYVTNMKYLKEQKVMGMTYSEILVKCQEFHQIMKDSRMQVPHRNELKFRESFQQTEMIFKRINDKYYQGENMELGFKKRLEAMERPMGEELATLIDELDTNIDLQTDAKEITEVQARVMFLEGFGRRYIEFKAKCKNMKQNRVFMNLEKVRYDRWEELQIKFTLFHGLWKGIEDWSTTRDNWVRTQFKEINVENMMKVIDQYIGISAKIKHELPERNDAASEFQVKVDEMKYTMPVVVSLSSSHLQERHWIEITKVLDGRIINREDPKFTLGSLLDMKVNEKKDLLAEIASNAQKEHALKAEYEKIKYNWERYEMTFEQTKANKDQIKLKKIEDLNNMLDEVLSGLTELLGIRHIKPIKDQVEDTYEHVTAFQYYLEEWIQLQSSFLYLQSILSNNPGGQSEMKLDTPIQKNYEQVMKTWTKLMNVWSKKLCPSKLREMDKQGVSIHQLKTSNTYLDQVQKNVERFLDDKRNQFPRFYFLSNDELLSIIAAASKMEIQTHLKKCFEGLVFLQFDDETNIEKILEFHSPEGEKVKFKKNPINVPLKQPTDQMLENVETGMRTTLIIEINDSYTFVRDEMDRTAWISKFPSQAVTIVDSIRWTDFTKYLLESADERIEENLEFFFDENVETLDDLTKMVNGPLTNIERRTIVALITQGVHYRDIIEILIDEQVTSVDDFKWVQQLRYRRSEKEVIIEQVDSVMEYGFEYLGATTRLVITPLTDRCWMTITGALRIKMGAAPAGPAGTGKTESTKDLAKALGKFCIVFNCSEQITSNMIGKLFTGLICVGAWSCLDEFNRIEIEVLSVIAQKIQVIRTALLEGVEAFVFEDKKEKKEKDKEKSPFDGMSKFGPKIIPPIITNRDQIGFNTASMGIFITMNPGYKGRTELPDNLKILFRPISMMIPDYSYIAEILLFSEGFSNAQPLSVKMTTLYKLCSEQLSQQYHYDFGMRAVKSVLSMAGQIKRANKNLPEATVLIRAMNKSNLPKFLGPDIPLFEAIVQDLFPGIGVPTEDFLLFEDTIREALIIQNYQYDQKLVDKIMQLWETMCVRFGTIIMGDTMTGKTAMRDILKETLCLLHKKNPQKYPLTKLQYLNPKSVTIDELYGSMDRITFEWTDGLASSLIRNIVQKPEPEEPEYEQDWVVFDGPVDSLWVENLNTVLDDNMTLCLANGERIKLKESMKILFEVSDLSGASPATVSRCGMIYLNPDVLEWKCITDSWLHSLSKKNEEEALCGTRIIEYIRNNLIDKKMEGAIEARLRYQVEPIPIVTNSAIISFTKLFEHLYLKLALVQPLQKEGEEVKSTFDMKKKICDKVFICSMVFALGSSLDSERFPKFDSLFAADFNPSELPHGRALADFFVDCRPETPYGEWVEFESIKKEFEYDEDKSYFEMIVETKDSCRYAWILREQLLAKNPVFFTGVTGVGKTLVATTEIDKLCSEGKHELISLTFSSKTTAAQTQRLLEEKLDKRRKGVLEGHGGKSVIVYIDDVNMPIYDQFGSQPAIELLRQFSDYHGFYDLSTMGWTDIKNTTLCCAAAPPGGGRKELSGRFSRHFHMICHPNTSDEITMDIFETITETFFRSYANATNNFPMEVISLVSHMVKWTLAVYSRFQTELLPTPQKSHYCFNLRDISKVFQGILMVHPKKVFKENQMIRLWIHETSRVFHDRLINHEDRDWFYNLISTLLDRAEYDYEYLIKMNIMFGNFGSKGVPILDRYYEEVYIYIYILIDTRY